MRRFDYSKIRVSTLVFIGAALLFGRMQAATAVIPSVPQTATQPTTTTTDAGILTNQKVLATNQTAIITNQNTLAQNQNFLNTNMEEWVGSAITESDMQNLLLDSTLTENGATNLVDQLKEVLSNAQGVQASAYQEQAVNLFQTASQSATMEDAKSNLMSDFVSLILSGAGNPNASETLWVSDVLDNVDDPSDKTISSYNSIIFPYVKINSSQTGFEVSQCSDSIAGESGASKVPCNLMKNVLYTQALTSSCSSSYAASSSSSSQASSSTSTAGQASSSSSGGSSGPQYDKSVYPSGFTGGCSAAYFQSDYNSWNGWNATLNAILAVKSLCDSFDPSSSVSDSSDPDAYTKMTTNIVNACSDYTTVVTSYDPKTGQDNSSIAPDLMADLITPLQDLIKYTRRLLVKQVFDYNMKQAIAENSDMAFYGSLYTLIGPDSYKDITAQTTTSTPTTTNGVTSIPVDLTPTLSQNCVNLIQKGGATVSITYEDTSQSKLANLLVMQLASMYPIRTVLPIVSFDKPDGSSAVVAIHGQLVALDSDGKVMTIDNSTSTSVPQIEQDVSQISSAQSSVQSAMVTANSLFQGQMDSYLKGKATAVSPLMEAYADRYLKITIADTSGSGDSCTLTPAQLNRYAATWRLNSQVVFSDAGGESSDSTTTSTSSNSDDSGTSSSNVTATWAEHIATSSASEVAKEIASLEAQSNYMKFQLLKQSEKGALIGTLVPLQQSTAMATTLKTQSAIIDKLVNDYVLGVKPASTSNSASSSASS